MLTVKQTFKLFDVVNKHFINDEDTRTFVSEIEEIMDNKVDLKMNDFATRKDLAELRFIMKTDIAELRTELKTDIGELRTELKTDISELRTELKTNISELRSEFQKLDAGINLNLANSAIMFEKSQKEQLKWLIGAMVAIMGLSVTIIKLL